MIHATKAILEDISPKIDFERFDALLEPLNLRDFNQALEELFVTFECFGEDLDPSLEIENGVVYLVVQIPYSEIASAEDPFLVQIRYFLSSLDLLEGLLDVERLRDSCREQLFQPG